MDRLKHAPHTWIVCLVLSAVVLEAFWPVLHNGFIRFDDNLYVTDNPHVLGGLQWDNVVWAFRTGHASNWHPVTWLSHMVDAQVFGLNPLGHHAVNLAFHLANTLLLFAVLRRMTGATYRSALVAALFALHPLHVESVAWVAERKDVLSTCFFMLTLWAYANYVETLKGGGGDGRVRKWSWYGTALLLFALALMSKPMVVTLPFVLLLVDFWPLERLAWARRGDVAVSGETQSQPSLRDASVSPPQPGVETPGYSQASLRDKKAATPKGPVRPNPQPSLRDSSVSPPQPGVETPGYSRPSLRDQETETPDGEPPNCGASAVGQAQAGSASVACLLLEKIPFFLLSAASGVVTFLVQDYRHAVAVGIPLQLRVANAIVSYFKYLGKTVWPTDLAIFYPHPDLGYPVVSHQWPGWQIALAALVLLAVSVSAITRRRREPWLLTGWFWFLGTLVPVIGIIQAGGQGMADRYTYLPLVGIFICVTWAAAEWLPRSRFARAAATLLAAAALLACATLAQAQVKYWRTNRLLFEHALAVTENNPVAHYMVGGELAQQGQWTEALPHFQAAVAAYPAYADAYWSLGYTLGALGKPAEALEAYQACLRLRPWHDLARSSVAALLWSEGKGSEALAQYDETLRANPDSAAALYGKGLILFAQGHYDEAGAHFLNAVKAKPNYPDAHEMLGRFYAQKGQLEAAAAEFQRVLELRPDAPAHYNLALAGVMQGRYAEAISHYQAALQLQPDWATALNDLAWSLATAPDPGVRDGAEAVRLAEKACQIAGETEPRFWGTLDAAYAEAGRFDDAIRAAEKTARLAQKAGDKEIENAAGKRLLLYRNRQPFHQS